MNIKRFTSGHSAFFLTLFSGLAIGAAGGMAATTAAPPTEHKDLKVEALGIVPPSSIETTVGLTGHKLQLRAVTIMPGGHIAKHGHENRPGLVKVITGAWIEGRESGETLYTPASKGMVEDENTVHWVFNRGDTAATAIVCDIAPETKAWLNTPWPPLGLLRKQDRSKLRETDGVER